MTSALPSPSVAAASPTGEQFELVSEADGRTSRVVITEVAAALRHYSVDGVDLTAGYPATVPTPQACGIVLVPWPNRVRDGRWLDGDRAEQLDITEPKFQNASHGLLRNTPYRLVERSPSRVVLSAAIFPQHGYPYTLDTEVEYELSPTGLTVRHSVTNRGAGAAPVAIGTHPYFAFGGVDTERLTVTVPARTVLETDERRIPVGRASVEGTALDLRSGRTIDGLEIDAAYTDIEPVTPADRVGALPLPDEAAFRYSLEAPDGRAVALWADAAHPFAQVFVSRVFPAFDADGVEVGTTTAIAIEPMTAPADAFNSGEGVVRLAPGRRLDVAWGIVHAGF